MYNYLVCQWRKLAMVNYEVDPLILKKYIPHKTELDLRNNTCYLSLVGFMFLDTRMLGFKIPFHINFEEVNLRFYVKHKDESHVWKRGVVFVKEIVPKRAVAFVARHLYGENYEALPMKHQWTTYGKNISVEYQWKSHQQWNKILIQAGSTPISIQPGSEEEFIFEHYWGYTKINEHKTCEYRVEHPSWQVYPVSEFKVDVQFQNLYGSEFEVLNNTRPASVFLAEGSEVIVKSKRII